MKFKSSSIYIPVLFVVILLQGCLSFEPVTVTGFEKIAIEKIDDGIATMDLQLKINNPNKTNIKVKEVDIKLSYGDVMLGKVYNNEGFKLKPSSHQSYTIPVQIDTRELKENSGALLKSFFKKGLTMNIDGYIKAGTFIISKEIEIHEKANLDVIKSLMR